MDFYNSSRCFLRASLLATSLSRQAKVYEREALLRALEAKSKGEVGFDIAIVDGEILTRYGDGDGDARVPGEGLDIMKEAG